MLENPTVEEVPFNRAVADSELVRIPVYRCVSGLETEPRLCPRCCAKVVMPLSWTRSAFHVSSSTDSLRYQRPPLTFELSIKSFQSKKGITWSSTPALGPIPLLELYYNTATLRFAGPIPTLENLQVMIPSYIKSYQAPSLSEARVSTIRLLFPRVPSFLT